MTTSEIESILNATGADKATLTAKGSPLEIYLSELTNSFVKTIRASIESKGSVASSRLKASVAPTKVTFSGASVDVGVEAYDYWKYVNYGVNGFQKNNNAPSWGSTGSTREQFLTAISGWRKDVGMTLGSWLNNEGEPMFKNYEQMDKSLMFLIAKNGQKGKHFLEDVVTDEFILEITRNLSLILEKTIEFKIDI